ncbi:MAG TPA: STAS domain-containing protein [Pseudonocardiaceae bacterium]|nr:STAS domain-containing protein [Pseudonocardiaceae bacterium]
MTGTTGVSEAIVTEIQPAAFAVSWHVRPVGAVVTVTGEIDLETAPAVDAALTEAAAQAPVLALDLSGVTFLGSAGLGLLVSWHHRHDSFLVVAPRPAVTRVMAITGLDQALTVVSELPDHDATV